MTVSRYDLRWIRRHPIKWLRVMWFPWLVGAMLAVKAVLIGEPVFTVVAAAAWWPVILGLGAGVAVTSSFAPLDDRLQAFVAATLFTVAFMRALTYAWTVASGDLSPAAVSLAGGFALHWVVLAAVAVWWPTILRDAGQVVAVEAGRDERAV